MRMGKIRFIIEYAVDLDNQDQVDIANEFIYDDVKDINRYDNIESYTKIIEDSSLTYNDIHDAILELTSEDDENKVME